MKPIPHMPQKEYIQMLYKHIPFMPAWSEEVPKRWGEIFSYTRTFKKYYFVSKPEWVQQVLRGDYQSAVKPPTYDILKPHLGDGLVTNQGETWLRQRRLSAPFFTQNQLDSSIPAINEEIRTLLSRWRSHSESKTTLDLVPDLNELTFRVLSRVILGGNLARHLPGLYSEISCLIEMGPQRMFSAVQLPFWMPTPFNRRFKASAKRYRALINDLLLSVDPHAQGCGMISHLIKKKGQLDTDTVDIVATMISAGFETTANAIAWILGILATHPVVQVKLRNEISKTLGDSPLNERNVFDVTYVKWVINEALRLFPPILYPSRLLKKGMNLEGYQIPKNGIVEMSIWGIHRDPRYWDNPNQFDPERFSPERFGKKQETAFIPFAVGPRECIGKQLALYELQLMVTQIIREYELAPAEGYQLKPQATLLLRPENGVRVRLSKIRHTHPQPEQTRWDRREFTV